MRYVEDKKEESFSVEIKEPIKINGNIITEGTMIVYDNQVKDSQLIEKSVRIGETIVAKGSYFIVEQKEDLKESLRIGTLDGAMHDIVYAGEGDQSRENIKLSLSFPLDIQELIYTDEATGEILEDVKELDLAYDTSALEKEIAQQIVDQLKKIRKEKYVPGGSFSNVGFVNRVSTFMTSR